MRAISVDGGGGQLESGDDASLGLNACVAAIPAGSSSEGLRVTKSVRTRNSPRFGLPKPIKQASNKC